MQEQSQESYLKNCIFIGQTRSFVKLKEGVQVSTNKQTTHPLHTRVNGERRRVAGASLLPATPRGALTTRALNIST